MKHKILCIGSRLVEADTAGPAVYDRLCRKTIPAHTDLVEGGIAGLDLLCHLEQAGVVVFVDAVSGFTRPGQMIVLTGQQVQAACPEPAYGHLAGITYLLAVLPRVCQGPLPEAIFLVGLEGRCDSQTLDRAADTALTLTRKNPVVVEKR
jgi:hydrogenase maturation protease